MHYRGIYYLVINAAMIMINRMTLLLGFLGLSELEHRKEPGTRPWMEVRYFGDG